MTVNAIRLKTSGIAYRDPAATTDTLCINLIKQLKQFPYSTLISIKNRHLFGGFLLPVNKWYNHFDNVINLFMRYKIMATCDSQPIGIGRGLVLSWVQGCGTDDPLSDATTPLVYTKLGFVETRGENLTPRTVTSNTDSSGIYTDTTVIGSDIEITASVLDAKDVVNVSSQQALRTYYITEVQAGRQPSVWVRILDPLLEEYRYYFCNVTSLGRSAENEGNRTGEFTFTAIPTYDDTNATYQSESINP